MKVFIPALKTALKLTEDWKFIVFHEYRNRFFLASIAVNYLFAAPGEEAEIVTLPKDTIILLDRIYIRKGGEEYNSVTFRIKDCPSDPRVNKKRFWTNLYYANMIECDII
jgi:hypothetical protein